MLAKREDEEYVKPKVMDREILPKMYQEHIRAPAPRDREQNYTNTGRYQLLNQKPPEPMHHAPSAKDRPKIKTERDYLNEIIRAQ